MLQQANTAVNIMRSALDERRSSVRIQIPIPAQVTSAGSESEPHSALVRDISTTGVYIYSNLCPEVRSQIVIDFVLPTAGKRIKVTCHGVVVRVEPSVRGGATGIAMHFHHHDLTVLY